MLRYTDVSLTMRIPFWGGHYLNLGWLAVPVLFFAVIGTVNGVNFTDGVDGLAIQRYPDRSCIFHGCIHWNQQSGIEPDHLCCCRRTDGIFTVTMYTRPSVFMGDTGSLALGGFVAGVAYMLQMPLFILIWWD